MNYLLVYENLINSRVLLNRKRKNNYYEKHHIIPRCLGGSNDNNNLVLLTAKEHFICHKLLAEIHPDNRGITNAFWMMSLKTTSNGNRNYVVSSTEYERARLLYIKNNSGANSCRFGAIPYNKGVKCSEEVKELLREKLKGRKRDVDSIQKQKETNKIRYPNKENLKGNLGKSPSKEVVERRTQKLIGQKRTEQFRINLSENRKGEKNPMYNKIPWNNGIKHTEQCKLNMKKSWENRTLVTCPYCNKEGHSNGMTRYHFNNCKFKNI